MVSTLPLSWIPAPTLDSMWFRRTGASRRLSLPPIISWGPFAGRPTAERFLLCRRNSGRLVNSTSSTRMGAAFGGSSEALARALLQHGGPGELRRSSPKGLSHRHQDKALGLGARD